MCRENLQTVPNLNNRGGGSYPGIYIAALVTWAGNVTEANEKREKKLNNTKQKVFEN